MSEEKTTETKNLKNLLTPKVIVPVVIAIVLIIAVTIMAFAVNTGDNIRGGVKINGLDVGGMSAEEALELVEATVSDFDDNAVLTVKCGDEEKNFAFSELMVGYDTLGAVEQAHALGRNGSAIGNFFKSVGIRLAGADVKIEPVLDEAYFSEIINSFEVAAKDPMVPNSYAVEDGRLKLVYGKPGDVIDKEKAFEDMRSALMADVDAEIVIAQSYAEPEEFDVDKIYKEICKDPVDAKYEIKDGKGYLVSAEDGYKFNKEDLKKLIEQNKGSDKPFYLDMEVIKSANTDVDTSEIFVDVLASYTSKITDSNANRLTNVRLAAEKINGVILNPDETFYYLKHVEPITVAGGYKVANVYSNGRVAQDVGGGVCQVSSALYSAVLNAELEVVKRYNHSLTVAYVPLGQDATVASGEVDLRFKNNTNSPIKIVTEFTPTGITAKILGQKVNPGRTVEIENITIETIPAQTVEEEDPNLAPGETVVETNPKTGYVVDTYKKIYQDGQYVGREYISRSVYRVLNKIVKVGPKTDAPVSGEGVVIPPAQPVTPPEVPEEPAPAPEEPAPAPEEPAPEEPASPDEPDFSAPAGEIPVPAPAPATNPDLI